MSDERCLACSQENCGYRSNCDCSCHGTKKKEKAAKPEKPKFTEVNCYEAHEDGSLSFYVDDKQIRIESSDVPRLMHAAIDALKGHASRR